MGILGCSFNILSEDFESFCISGFCTSIFRLLLTLVGSLTWSADETCKVDRAESFPSLLRSVLEDVCSVGFTIFPGLGCVAL
jgi:hypothetical protein